MLRLGTSLFLILPAFCAAAHATEYAVGPGQVLATPDRVPWEKLEPGDVVLIHYRPEPYLVKWAMQRPGTAEKPITVRGVPGPKGELPVIDGRNAVTRPGNEYPSEGRGVIIVGGYNPGSSYVVVENLEVRSARPGFEFLGRK